MPMKRLALLFLMPCLLLCSKTLLAATPPNPADYTVNIHVTSSRVEQTCTQPGSAVSCAAVLRLNATIDGQKYEMQGGIQSGRVGSNQAGATRNFSLGRGFLALGDYKARLLPANAKDPDVPYYVIKNYEILLPDGRLAGFQVIGQTE